MSAEDVTAIKEYVRDLLVDGYTVSGTAHAGIGRVVEENQKRITAVGTAVTALGDATGLAAAIAAALPPDAPVNVDDLETALRKVLGSVDEVPS